MAIATAASKQWCGVLVLWLAVGLSAPAFAGSPSSRTGPRRVKIMRFGSASPTTKRILTALVDAHDRLKPSHAAMALSAIVSGVNTLRADNLQLRGKTIAVGERLYLLADSEPTSTESAPGTRSSTRVQRLHWGDEADWTMAEAILPSSYLNAFAAAGLTGNEGLPAGLKERDARSILPEGRVIPPEPVRQRVANHQELGPYFPDGGLALILAHTHAYRTLIGTDGSLVTLVDTRRQLLDLTSADAQPPDIELLLALPGSP